MSYFGWNVKKRDLFLKWDKTDDERKKKEDLELEDHFEPSEGTGGNRGKPKESEKKA